MYRIFLNMVFLLVMGTGFSLASTLVRPEKLVQLDTVTKERKKVTIEQLPQEVKNVLNSNLYNAWKVTEIYFVRKDTDYYEIILSKDGEKQTINLDKFGKKVKTV